MEPERYRRSSTASTGSLHRSSRTSHRATSTRLTTTGISATTATTSSVLRTTETRLTRRLVSSRDRPHPALTRHISLVRSVVVSLRVSVVPQQVALLVQPSRVAPPARLYLAGVPLSAPPLGSLPITYKVTAMEYVVVLDAAAPSARLNAGLGVLAGVLVEGGPPTVLAVTCSEVDTSHSHLLRAKVKSDEAPVFWVPYSHLVGILEGPSATPASMGFTAH